MLAFILSMPNVGSWNGRWTGEGNLYAKVVNLGSTKKDTERAEAILKTGYFYYSFGDGWGAGVSVKKVDAKEASRIRKASKGFCGYDWMVSSILERGEIVAPSGRL